MSPVFPFTAIVGQDEMKQALLLSVVDPRIGGVLVFGDRGTGKSTAIRALAGLLPSVPARADCPFGCDPDDAAGQCDVCRAADPKAKARVVRRPVPVVDLPLGATEDRIVGALDLERALAEGVKAFQPGLLARANRGFLYIDEVNLLEDHLIDLLLDVAASGENVVERDGLSLRHPARFVLIGSGNPEEGELRPQLLDRFGLSVEVTTPLDVETRVEVVRQRDAFDRDPEAFVRRFATKERALRRRLEQARARLDAIEIGDDLRRRAAELCLRLKTDGLRGELVLLKAARATAALEGARAVEPSHLVRAAPSALRHRLRRDPLDEAGSTSRVERALEELFAA
ncbi:MAG: magnesium chelatase ATPase subunit I [Myxococcota bacterium]